LWAKHFPGKKQPPNSLGRLFAKDVTWWDVFVASDIGAERNLIADKLLPRGAEVLDVGCGRGYFSFVCTKKGAHVTAIDLMDGEGRTGWWNEFKRTSELLGVSGLASGVRASATLFPFTREHFDLVASVHSIRNFGGKEEIRSFFHEAKRVMRPGGRLFIVESDLESAGPTYGAFYSMRTKLGWELRLPSIPELIRWLRNEGFSKTSDESFETNLEYAPVYFPFDPASMKDIRRDYNAAMKLYAGSREHSPPVFVLTAIR
jgi:ubiquinone/menaquinone biosynthesis C-methylase UbiE